MAVGYKDYYKTLGVSRSASGDEIQKSFRKLARKFHPDVSKEKGAEDKFKEINEAYEVLKDPEKRKLYDSLGADWKTGQEFRPPPNWEQMFSQGGFAQRPRGGQRASTGGSGLGGFSDFFNSIFGGFSFDGGVEPEFSNAGSQMRGARQGQTLETDLSLSLEELYHGGKKAVELSIVETQPDGGQNVKKRNYSITIPPGTSQGSIIRLGGQGGKGSRGGQDGDIRFKVQVLPHHRLKLSGSDIIGDLPVSAWEAALGAKVPFRTLDGEVRLTVPPGSQTGTRLRLKGKGVPKNKTERGDMFAELRIVVPSKLTSAEEELLEKLSKTSSFDPRRDFN